MKFISSTLAVALVPLMIVSPVWAQAPAALLQLHLVDSDGSRVAANTRTAKGIAIQVSDANGAPVSDAAVAFRFPESGSSASFADGSRSIVAYTDAGGKAQIANFQWNDTPGTVALRVTASKANSHAGLLVEQQIISNAPAPAPVAVQPIAVASNDAEAAIPQTDASSLPALKPAIIRSSAAEIPSEYVPNPYRLPRPGIAPMISIKNTGSGGDKEMVYHGSRSKKKWIMLGVLAGAGAGIAFAVMNSRSGAATSASGVSVGTPTISIGHP